MAAEIDELVSRVRFRHLRMLIELQRSGTIRAAAQALHLTQPAISKTLSEVENAFGFTLFLRGARGLTLTPQGEVVLRGAVVLIAELDHLQNEARAAQPKRHETLRLGVTQVLALTLVPKVLARLLNGTPPVFVELTEDRVSPLFEALILGELDALLTSYGPAVLVTKGAEPLRYDKLRDEEFVLIARHNHPLASTSKVTWPQLVEEPWILPRAVSFVRQTVESSFIRAGVRPPKPVIVSDSPVTNVRLVAQGLGIALVPADATREVESAGIVARLRVHPPLQTVPIALIYRSSSAGHPRILKLLDAVEHLRAPVR